MTPPRWRQPGVLLGGVAAAGLLSVAVALATQHLMGMQPCPWCVLQRLLALAMAAAALVGLGLHALRLQVLRSTLAAVAGLLAASGLAAALWQHFVAAQSTSCALSWADKLMTATGLDTWWPEVFAPMASCAEAKAVLLGLPYEAWSGALFVGCLLALLLSMRSARRR